MKKKPIRIMVIEDHPEFRETLEYVINKEPDFKLCGQFGNAELALRAIKERDLEEEIDVILLDLHLPGMNGLEAIKWLLECAKDVKILVLSQSDNEVEVLTAIQQGVSGYLLKSSTMELLITGIKEVHDGGATIDPSLAKLILDSLKSTNQNPVALIGLSKRELDVITLIAQGFAQKEIAAELGISVYTVTDHLKHIYSKLNVQNAPQAVAEAYKSGILPK